MSEIIKHLETIRDITSSKQREFYDWILKNGVLFRSEDLMVEDSKVMSQEILAERKECFKNSYKVAYIEGLDYYEGYYYFEDIGLITEHGWNVKDGKVIDVTSVLLKTKPIEWYGVKISLNHQIEYYGQGIVEEYKKQIKS